MKNWQFKTKSQKNFADKLKAKSQNFKCNKKPIQLVLSTKGIGKSQTFSSGSRVIDLLRDRQSYSDLLN
jgi:hypothetical protein